jgi:hypothetical protein
VNVGSVDPPTGVNAYGSISFAADGTPYIGFTSAFLDPQGLPRTKGSVKKFNGTSWEYVGDQYFNDSYSESFLNVCVAPDGTPYAAYQDELIRSATYGPATVKKFDGTTWVTVGSPRFTPVDADLLKMVIAPDGTPYIAYGDPDLTATTLTFGKKAVVMKFNGNTWVNAADDVSAGEAADVSFTLTKDGSRLLIGYNNGGGYVKSLLIGGIVLPVRLIEFSASLDQDQDVSLQWKVAEQVNITRYEIERKLNGNNFENIGVVNANSQNEFTYQFTDPYTSSGSFFYRLKIIEQDGSFTYSNVVKIILSAKNHVKLYPVPASEKIMIQTTGELYVNSFATIIDNSGRVISKQLIKNNTESINISRLANGIYYLMLKDGTSLKFQKIY